MLICGGSNAKTMIDGVKVIHESVRKKNRNGYYWYCFCSVTYVGIK